MRLIDADRFYDDLDELQNRKQECAVDFLEVFELLSKQKTLKSPRGQSDWKDLNCMNEVYGSLYECSACGEQVVGNTPYCPECGKLMKNGKARFF